VTLSAPGVLLDEWDPAELQARPRRAPLHLKMHVEPLAARAAVPCGRRRSCVITGKEACLDGVPFCGGEHEPGSRQACQ